MDQRRANREAENKKISHRGRLVNINKKERHLVLERTDVNPRQGYKPRSRAIKFAVRDGRSSVTTAGGRCHDRRYTFAVYRRPVTTRIGRRGDPIKKSSESLVRAGRFVRRRIVQKIDDGIVDETRIARGPGKNLGPTPAFSFKGHKARRQGQPCKKGAIKCKCTHIPCCDPWRVEAASRRPPPSAATDYSRPSLRPILEHPRSSFLPRPPLYPAAARASCLSYRFQRPCGSERGPKRAKRAVL